MIEWRCRCRMPGEIARNLSTEAKKPPRLPSAAFAPLLSTVISHRQNIRSRGLNRLSSRRLEAALILSRYNNIRSPTRLGRDIRPSATISSNLMYAAKPAT
jgi:hypothetical protein